MLTRDPDAFLYSLYEALNRRLEMDRGLFSAVLSFYAAKYAAILRMKAIDDLANKFEEFANQPNRAELRAIRLPIENQILFDFFANGLAALESFCFCSYYLGVAVDGSKFDIKKRLKKIKPGEVRNSFEGFAPTETFTLALTDCLESPEFTLIKAIRNLLLHSVAPGRTIRVFRPDLPDIIDLELWYEGDWSRAMGGVGIPEPSLKFSLEPNALNKQRDWIDGQLGLLSTALCDLASAHGLK